VLFGVWDTCVQDYAAFRDADHPEREFEAHENNFVEFEIILWKETRGVFSPRWILGGVVANPRW
jgi:hypothetical protein